jgi:hypothetical protein
VSAPAFTPGPWREGIDGNNRVYGPDASGEHTGLIAVVYKGRANIRLIAAAPELYEALRRYREWAAHFDANVPQDLCDTTAIALAKARGEQ